MDDHQKITPMADLADKPALIFFEDEVDVADEDEE